MWMLEREAGVLRDGETSHQLAACPDTFGRGDVWKWAVGRVAASAHFSPQGAPVDAETFVIELADGTSLVLAHDQRHVAIDVDIFDGDTSVVVSRKSGSEVLIVPLDGSAHVEAPNKAWKRDLSAGDIFIIEGEDDEVLHVDSTSSPCRIASIHISSTSPQALRWVP